jgi:DNA replication protein DnaC
MKGLVGQQQNDFEQVVDDRYRKKALIISSQLPVNDWYAVIGNELIADYPNIYIMRSFQLRY